MTRRPLAALAAALALLSACNKASSSVSFRLAQPSSIAVAYAFGKSHTDALPWPYAFVANTAHDEIVFFDAIEDNVVPASIILRPLSIPLPDPRPTQVASAEFLNPLDNGGAAGPPSRPSLLVAVSAGSTQLQLIRTWHSGSNTQPDPGLAGPETTVDLGGPVLALLATPAPDASGDVWVIAALAEKRLAVVDYKWSDSTGAAPSGPAVVQDIGFDALSLAVDPTESGQVSCTTPPCARLPPTHLFAASMDLIGSVQGVAQFDMTAGLGSTWPKVAIDAGGPTRLVAALTLQERVAGAKGAYDQITSPDVPTDGPPTNTPDNALAFEPAPGHSRVYAWRDPSSCGPTTDTPCGIVVLDPASQGLAKAAFLGDTPFPITVPSRPVALLAGPPPFYPPTDQQPPETSAFMAIHAVNPRITTGVLAIPCEDGRIYYADLARWEVPSEELEVAGNTFTGVATFTGSATTSRRVGFYEPAFLLNDKLSDRRFWSADLAAASYIQVTPGFTPTDTWTVTYQGYLPDFATSRAVEVEQDAGNDLRVSFQARFSGSTPDSTILYQTVNVTDGTLGVRVGDIVEIWTGPTAVDPSIHASTCPDTTVLGGDDKPTPPIEGHITSIVPPDLGHPGGSLIIEPRDCTLPNGGVTILNGLKTECNDQTHGPWGFSPTVPHGPGSKPNCWPALPTLKAMDSSGHVLPGARAGALQARIRTGGGAAGAEEFVVVGAATGYAGRAVASMIPPPPTRDEKTWPALTFFFTSVGNPDEPTLTHACNTCAIDCQSVCEQAAIARRARRTHLTSVKCAPPTSGELNHCQIFYPQFDLTDASPYPDGPTLAFSLGLQCSPGTSTTCTPEQITASTKALVRDTQVTFTTRSGWNPGSRFAGGANGGPSTLPTGVSYIDRTVDNGARFGKQFDRYRFLVPYVDNVVLDVSPGQTNGDTRAVR